MNRHKIFQATLFIAISAILYGFLGFLGTGILRENISLSTMLFWRFLIAGVWIFLFTKIKGSSSAKFNPISNRILFYTFILGATGYAGSSAFFFAASQYTGTGLAMVMFFSYPIIVALTSLLTKKESFNFFTVVTLIAMTTGLFLLQDFSTQQFNIIGIFFGMIAAICYAFYIIGSKQISSLIEDSSLLTIIVSFGCAFIFLLLSLSSHSFVFPHSVKSWLYFLALGILATALPIQLMLIGLRHVSSIRASIISVLEPLVTIIIGVSLLDESISHLQMLGAFIILVSALLVQFQKETVIESQQ